MATSRTFEALWEKLENERKAFDTLFKDSVAMAEEGIESLTIIKRNLEEILARAHRGLRDPWEEDEITRATNELLETVTNILQSIGVYSSR